MSDLSAIEFKPSLPPAAIAPVAATAEEKKDDEDDENEFHGFLQS
jgi:hypothetical protein